MIVQFERQAFYVKGLMERLLDAGYPRHEMRHNGRDLLIPVTPMTSKAIDEWCAAFGYYKPALVRTYTDDKTHEEMYECAYQYFNEDLEKYGT